MRWHHPERGLLAPGTVHPVRRGDRPHRADRPLGRLAKRAARGRLDERFPRDPALTISVNVSVQQLQSDSIVEDVGGALEESGLAPRQLMLEITETRS